MPDGSPAAGHPLANRPGIHYKNCVKKCKTEARILSTKGPGSLMRVERKQLDERNLEYFFTREKKFAAYGNRTQIGKGVRPIL